MKLQEIERLLEKFYNGETSLREERQLKEFFASGEVPARFQAEKVQFDLLAGEKTRALEDDQLEKRVMQNVSGSDGLLGRVLSNRPLFYSTIGMAATILILLAIFLRFEPLPKKIQDTYSDPEVAYNEAKKVLFYVSKQFNRGTDKLQPIAAFDDGVRELRNIQTLNEGLSAASKLKKYNKIEQMMTKSN